MTASTHPPALLRALLPTGVLTCLETGNLHGYGIAARLEELGFGRLKGGSLYPALSKLEDAGAVTAGWIEGNGGPARRGFPWAIAAGGATTVGLSFSLAFALEQAQHLSRPVPIWWHLVATLGMLALIVLFYKLVPDPANHREVTNYNPSDQHAWLRTFRTELNKRNDMTGARVRDEVALVLAHSRETGTTFDEEFGHPVTYARSLAGQSSVKPYRLMLYAFFIVAAGIYWFYSALTAGDGSVWWRVPLGLFVLIILVLEAKASWVTYRSSRQASALDA